MIYHAARGTGRYGLGHVDGKILRILFRIMTYGDSGIQYKADEKHAELVSWKLTSKDREVRTPGEDAPAHICASQTKSMHTEQM